jgi:hypothetical protein
MARGPGHCATRGGGREIHFNLQPIIFHALSLTTLQTKILAVLDNPRTHLLPFLSNEIKEIQPMDKDVERFSLDFHHSLFSIY